MQLVVPSFGMVYREVFLSVFEPNHTFSLPHFLAETWVPTSCISRMQYSLDFDFARHYSRHGYEGEFLKIARENDFIAYLPFKNTWSLNNFQQQELHGLSVRNLIW